jgi:hypothetical protein
MNQKQQSLRNHFNMAIAIRTHGVVEVPAEMALHESELIDRLLALAFDVLGWQTLEIRVRPQILHSMHIT